MTAGGVRGAGRCAAALLFLASAAVGAAPTVFVTSPESLALNRPFSDATQVGNILYLSGQIGAVPGEDHVVPGGLEAETKQIMANIGALLKRRGLGFGNLFKCTVMLGDMKQWDAFNRAYVPYFKPGNFPSRSAMGVNGLAKNASVELECWANTGH
jgi:2-iminobutanoate/2-iminopropanoate deaminase